MKLGRSSLAVLLSAVAGVVTLVWAGVLASGHLEGRGGVLDRVEAMSLDLRYLLRGAEPAPDGIVLAAIDDATVTAAGRFPLPRQQLAQLVGRIAAVQPKAIVIDLLFLDPASDDSDRILARALAAAPTVIGMAAVFGPQADGAMPRAAQLLQPGPGLSQAAAVGTVNVATDHGGTPRHVPLLMSGPDGQPVPSIVLLAASRATDGRARYGGEEITVGDRVLQLDRGAHLPIRFYGPRGTIPQVSANLLLQGGVPAARLRDKVVVIGATATGSGDTFPNPFSPVVSGAEVLATAIANLTQGPGLERSLRIRQADAAAAFGLALAVVMIFARYRAMTGFLLAGSLGVLWCGFAMLVFPWGLWLSVAVPLGAWLPALLLCGLARLWVDRTAAVRVAQAVRELERFQPPQLSARIAADPSFLAEPERQLAAVLFLDLGGFTALAERIGPARARDLLREYHELVDDAAQAAGGFVVSFMGDGAMLLFGFPEDTPKAPAQALAAALDLRRRLAAWGQEHAADTGTVLRTRIGVNAGPVVVSRLGSTSHEHITATGDTVNVASRLMEIAKQEGASVVAADSVPVPAGAPFSDPVEFTLRGRVKPVRVRLLAHPDVMEA